MDLHQRPAHDHPRTGRDCQFCQNSDPNFRKRNPLDRLVVSNASDNAASHMTENGYVEHRMLEIQVRLAVMTGSLQHVA
jgi:hypothetical protein